MPSFEKTPGEPKLTDLFSEEMEERMRAEGHLFSRRTSVPIAGARQVEAEETVETIVKEFKEDTRLAKVGDWVVTGSTGEQFKNTDAEFHENYEQDESGQWLPKEKSVLVLPNPTGEPIAIIPPWANEENPGPQRGDEHCFIVFVLSPQGDFTDNRYLIANEDILHTNYTEVV